MRILVADDHSLFRDGVVSLLEAAGFEVVGQAGDGLEAVHAALQLRPDLVLMDLSMPGQSGLEALRQIRAAWPEARVVMLTVSDTDADLFDATESGAAGYLLKSLDSDEFLDMLRGVERGEAAMTRRTTARLLHAVARHTGDRDHDLTPREIELLQLLAEGASNKAIAQAMALSENTVKYHIKNILQKLGLHNRTEAAAYAIRTGLTRNTPSRPNG